MSAEFIAMPTGCENIEHISTILCKYLHRLGLNFETQFTRIKITTTQIVVLVPRLHIRKY